MSELFKPVPWTIQNLVAAVESGTLRLPDIQRPFVWDRPKVRDLIDSLYRGFPVGELMFWLTTGDEDSKAIGTEAAQQASTHKIVDGQQRLTSLYVVLTGKPVFDDEYKSEQIRISFNPLVERFEVWNAAIDKSPEWITDISDVFKSPLKARKAFFRDYRKTKELTDDEEERIEGVITRLAGLKDFIFTVVEIQAGVDREKVAEIFVRINSEGVNLTQADFILTWLSVFWDEGRDEIEEFSQMSRLSPEVATERFEKPVAWTAKNNYIAPNPGQMLKVIIALGQNRGKLRDAYRALKGLHPRTGVLIPENREKELAAIKEAQAHALKSTNWDDFLRCLAMAGFRSKKMVTSQNTILYSYALWLIGLTRYKVERARLRHLMAKWFFMSQTTGRYTNSPETRIEEDLRRFEHLNPEDADGFVAVLDQVMETVFTADYWAIQLPEDFITSIASNSPAYQAYVASLVLLEADLFALPGGKVRDWLDPTTATAKNVETHHLFPKAHLTEVLHITGTKRINQAANYAPSDWSSNGFISDSAPKDYWPVLVANRDMTGETLRRQMFWHALPEAWQDMAYDDFLANRRRLMAKVVKAGFARLSDPNYEPKIDELTEVVHANEEAAEVTLADLLAAGILKAGDSLVPINSNLKVEAEITEDAVIAIESKTFNTPLRAAREVDPEEADGWNFWALADSDPPMTLADLARALQEERV